MGKTFASVVGIRQRTLGVALKTWREASGFSQREVADALGYSTPQFISNWERGISAPAFDVMPALGKLFERKPEEVIAVVEACQDELRQAEMAYILELFKDSASD